MQIRKMTIDDYDQAYALWLNTPGMGLDGNDDSKDNIQKYLCRNPNTCFIAENDGKIIGAILSGHDGRRGYINHTFVIASERKKGIGTALLNKVLDAFKTEGISKAALFVLADNDNGNDFWEKRGFYIYNGINYRTKPI